MKKSNFLLKIHAEYAQRVSVLKARIKELKAKLSREEFLEHPDVKFAARIRHATTVVIPEDPDRKEYRLHGPFKKYRRYKRGLQRYRLFYCFSFKPPIIVYLYINDEKSLRKEGSKSDPYVKFQSLVKRGVVSSETDSAGLVDLGS